MKKVVYDFILGESEVVDLTQEEINQQNYPFDGTPVFTEEQTKIKTLEQQLKQTNEDMMAFMEVIMGGM